MLATVGIAIYETITNKKMPMWFPPIAVMIVKHYFDQRDKDGKDSNV